jgi:protein-tyrosine phosphatase
MVSWSEDTSGLVILPDGRRVRGRGLRYKGPSVDARPELGVYLCARSPAPEAWESVWICWPDFLLPLRIAEAVAAFRYAHGEAANRRVEIACHGGVGRTGTAIALLARLAGVPAAEAVAWSRAHFRAGAVETPWQRRFVAGVDLDR